MQQILIIVGNGMVGHKLIELMVEQGANHHYRMITFCEEAHLAYDRVNLSSYFAGRTDLSLVEPDFYQQNHIEVYRQDRVVAIDPQQQTVTSAQGLILKYDLLVFATGSYPFVPPIPGREIPGTFVYRTIDDLDAIRVYAQNVRVGTVIGGGLLGLECANALTHLGLETHVVEFAPRLMPLQVDEVGGALLRKKIEMLGVQIHTSKSTTEICAADGRVQKMLFADGSQLETDMIVFSAGIRPRDELARACGLVVGERGGIVIDEWCRTSDASIYAIGECASYQGRTFGLVAPGYQMAAVVADQLCVVEEPSRFTGADMSTKLKLMGVDVASFGDAFGTTPQAQEISLLDAVQGTYKKIVIDAAGKRLLGGILVGDASNYGMLHQIMQNGIAIPPHPEDLILPAHEKAAAFGIELLPAAAKICTCENVSKDTICTAIADQQLRNVTDIKKCTGAGTGCGACVPMLNDILKSAMQQAGIQITNHLCEHFPYSRQELYHLVRVQGIHTFDDLLERHGKGLGCEICKPAVASILATTSNEYIQSQAHIPLQDSNDHFMANIQRDGTYSVVPRVPGGEITPEKLITIGEVARDFGLYVKITGGQRIDLFGARVEQLPLIWVRLIAAGFESGHAYGKALRTVKSCVGSTWCRYGQQDSVALAIRLEERYKGLRAPHKIKAAVSGCKRECAEAQGKDFGLIATEKGYNLYVGGNGGMNPQHAVLLAEDLNEETVVKYLDRFLMFYIRTGDRLQRTATWLNNLEGGIDYLKQVIMEDVLGICEELEREMAYLVSTYQCEWKTTLENTEALKRFRTFVNTDQPDPNVIFVEERGQIRPAYPDEKPSLIPQGLIAS